MAARALQMLNNVCVKTFIHASQPAFARGVEVKFNGDDNLLQAAGANDPLAIGITEVANDAGSEARVALYGIGIIPVTVGTGDATRGVDATTVASGFTNAATNGAGTVSQIIKGKFMQSGVANDLVGLLIGVNQRSVTA